MLRLLSLAWPIVISRSTQVVIGLSDAVMVGVLGESALAATTTGSMNAMNLMILPMGIVFIVSTFASQHHGAGDKQAARRYGVYGLVVALITEVVALLCLPLVDPLLGTFSLEPEVRRLMTAYLWWRLPSAGAVVGMEALAGYYGAIGNTRLPMLANVLAMVLNVIGDWLLITGKLGAPALGVVGASLASSVSTFVAFLVLTIAFFRGVGAGERGIGRLALGEFGRMLRYGIPSGLNWFLEFAAFTTFINVIVADLGTTALAAMMAVLQVNMVAFMPAFGVASAGAILVGQAIGEGKKDEVPGLLRQTLIATSTWQGLVGAFYLLMPAALLSAFANGDQFLEVGSRLMMIAAAWQVFDAVANTYAEGLRATGDTTFTLWARVAIAWAFFFPGVYLQRRFLGLSDTAAITWVVVYIALLAGVLHLRFKNGAWRRIDLVGAT